MEDSGIEALKGWGGWSLFFAWAIWWVRGIPDRRRADSDASSAAISSLRDANKDLQAENVGLRDRLAQLENDYETHRKECREETDKLHDSIRALKENLDGLKRDIAAHSQITAMQLGAPRP